MMPQGMDAFTAEDRHQAYKTLKLKVVAHPHGGMEATGIVVLSQGTINVST